MKIKKGDKVVVLKGKDRGKTSKVIKVLSKQNKLIVEDVKLVKKRVRPKKEGEKGKILEIESPIPVANVSLVCPNCNRGVRVGYKIENGKKIRICKKCGKKV